MKKTAFVIIMFFVLSLISTTVFAETDPEFATALKYYNTQKYEKAIEHFKEYLKKKPDPAANYLIGYSLYKLKKFDEAEDFFNEAFLLDPDFSLEKVGLVHKVSEGQIQEVAKPSTEQTAPPQKQPEPKKETVPVKQPAKEAQPQKPEAAKVAPEKKAVQPEPQKAKPKKVEPKVVEPQKVEPPAVMPSFPAPKKAMPGAVPAVLTGLFAGFLMIFLIIGVALYIFYSLCLFLIAKKLNVSAPWTAWVPLVQLWTIVASAGKPWWWIILIFIPIVGPLVVFTYLWMCITENLGKNKWLGLLVLVPIANLIWPAILAFSKSEQYGGAGGSGFGGTTEDTTVIAEDKTQFTDDKTHLPE